MSIKQDLYSFLFEHLNCVREGTLMPNGYYTSGGENFEGSPFIIMARNAETMEIVPVQVELALNVIGHDKDTFAIQLLYTVPPEELEKAPWLQQDRSSIAMPLRTTLWDLSRQAGQNYKMLFEKGDELDESEADKRVLPDEAHYLDSSGAVGVIQMQCPVKALEQFQRAAFELHSGIERDRSL